MSLLVGFLTAPPVLFSLTLGLILVLLRSPWPWTRFGGGFLLALGLGILAAVLIDPGARELLFDPERLPVLVLVVGSGGAMWAAFHQARHRRRHSDEEAPPWRGPSAAEALAGGIVVVLAALGAFALGAPLAAMAEPGTAAGVAPWFLLGLQEMRSYFDPWVPTVLLPLLALASLVALPYLDVPEESPSQSGFDERRDVAYFFVFVWFLLFLLPMASAAFLRPAIAPVQAAPVPPDLALSFSELVWSLAVEPPPRPAWLRELPAVVVLGLYFVALPRQLPRWKPTRALFGRYLKRLGPRRFYVAMAMVLVWMLLPLKMYGRWLLGIGFFLDLPELSFRF